MNSDSEIQLLCRGRSVTPLGTQIIFAWEVLPTDPLVLVEGDPGFRRFVNVCKRAGIPEKLTRVDLNYTYQQAQFSFERRDT